MPIKGDGIYPSVPQTNLLPVCPATVWQVETGTPPWCDSNICVSAITLVMQLFIYPGAPQSLLKCPEIMVLSVAAVAAACVVHHCGVICQPLAAVCRASVDLKPVIGSRHRAASYRETEYWSQIVFRNAVTQREICRISFMDHKHGSFVHVKQSMCHTHAESRQNVSAVCNIYICKCCSHIQL